MPTAYLSPSQLQDLTNVSSTAPSSGDNGKALVWNQAAGRWQAEQVAYSNLSGAPTIPTVNNGQLSLGVSGNGLTGSQTFTANQSGNATFTVASNATADNTASTIVYRDSSGNFQANQITAKGLNAEVFREGLITKNLWDFGNYGFGTAADISAFVDRLYRADRRYTVTSTNINSVESAFDGIPDSGAVVFPTGTSETPTIATIEIDFSTGIDSYPYGFTYGSGIIAVTNYPFFGQGTYKVEGFYSSSWVEIIPTQNTLFDNFVTTRFYKDTFGTYLRKLRFTFTCTNTFLITNLRYFPTRPGTTELKNVHIDSVGLTQRLISQEDSTNTTSGALRVAGGVGIAKSLIVGGSRVNLANLPTSLNSTVAIGDLWRDGDVIKVRTS
jgi:hypothetical protein